MRIFAPSTNKTKVLLLTAGVLTLITGSYLLTRQYAPFLFEVESLRRWLDNFGVFAPLVFILLQAVQVIVAPIPGQVAAVVAGYLFGGVWGTIYSLIGVMLGSAIAFTLSKHYGRPAVEQLLDDDLIDSFDGFAEEAGLFGIFVFVIIPGLPDDVVCFLAGLTPLRLVPFLLVLLAGRFPAYALANYAGGQFASGRLVEATFLLSVFVAVSAYAYLHIDEIQDHVRRL